MCNCRKNVVGQPGGAPGSITGFDYTSPAGVTTPYLTIIEARAAQRRNGGGTIKTVRSK